MNELLEAKKRDLAALETAEQRAWDVLKSRLEWQLWTALRDKKLSAQKEIDALDTVCQMQVAA